MQEVKLISLGTKYRNHRDVPKIDMWAVSCLGLLNPYSKPLLREKTGMEADVQNFVMDENAFSIVNIGFRYIQNKLKQGKNTGGVAYCRGGKHRSVTILEVLARKLEEDTQFPMTLTVTHMELDHVQVRSIQPSSSGDVSPKFYHRKSNRWPE